MRLFTTPQSANGVKALATVHHLDIDATVVEVNVYTGAGRQPDYLAINPLGKIPTLVDEGRILTESNAILQYFAHAYGGGRLWAHDPFERADISRWMFWESAHWQPTIAAVLMSHVAWKLGLGAPPAHDVDWHDTGFERLASHLDTHLESRRFVVGSNLTVADFSIAAMLIYVRDTGFPHDRHPAVSRWYRSIERLPAWRAAVAGSPWQL